MQVKTAVCEYMQKSNYYVEYLHFNNNGQLDGFLDHQNNMYVENNEYETRKKICDKLFNIYYGHDFMWANQSYTALANSLFKIMIGYLPESSYNNEYSMTPNRYITLLYQAFTKYDITIIMSGDTNQCEPINNTKSIRHNYFDDSISVSEMCPRRRKLEYIEELARYETRLVLERFLKYKNIRHKFEPIGNYYKNICWLNETRQKVTEDCCNRFVQDKEYYDINFKYKSRIEKYKVCVKMPIIATQNMEKRDMFNMMEFNIDNIIENDEGNLEFEINNETFSLNEFRESFLPNFCNTVYKYQGGKIDEHYNIWDTHKMDVKEMYTALSRTTKLEYIHLDKKNYVVDTKKESKTT